MAKNQSLKMKIQIDDSGILKSVRKLKAIWTPSMATNFEAMCGIVPDKTKNDILNYLKERDEFLVHLNSHFQSLCSGLNDKYKTNRNRA